MSFPFILRFFSSPFFFFAKEKGPKRTAPLRRRGAAFPRIASSVKLQLGGLQACQMYQYCCAGRKNAEKPPLSHRTLERKNLRLGATYPLSPLEGVSVSSPFPPSPREGPRAVIVSILARLSLTESPGRIANPPPLPWERGPGGEVPPPIAMSIFRAVHGEMWMLVSAICFSFLADSFSLCLCVFV